MMFNMKPLTLFKRLVLSYLVILMVVIALGVYSTSKLDELRQIIHSISAVDNETKSLAGSLKDSVLSQSALEKKYIVSKDKDFYSEFLSIEKHIQNNFEQIDVLADTIEIKRLIKDARKLYRHYLSAVQEEVDLIEAGREFSQKTYEKIKEELTDDIIRNLDEVIMIADTEIDLKMVMSEQISFQAAGVTVILTIGSAFMAILIAFFNALTINRPISHLIKGTREIANGKFEKHLSIASPPEINELADAFNHMSDRLKEIDDMKADLISRISHELRTPLTVIREAVSLHRECVSTGSEKRQIRLLAIVEEESERLITSVNKILDLSRMEAGMMDYHMEVCNLLPLVENSVSKVAALAERKKISIDVDFDLSLPNACIDAEKIGEVLDNLIGNALKFSPEQGRVSISAKLKDQKLATGNSNQRKQCIEVAVSDNGPGIPEESIDGIFDKFKKLHGKGSGLGLHIARQIVTAHGGDIWVKSDHRNGSTFFFTVPAC
jgi:two-component system, NtrC family, sensor histidine kinase GlrK